MRLHTRGTPIFPSGSWFAVVAATLCTLAFTAGAAAQKVTDDSADYLDVEVATVGIDLSSGTPLAVLHADWERVVPIFIGDGQAQEIARARQGIATPRPMTHDLLASVIGVLDGTLEEVRVHDLREGTYLGALVIRVGEELREVDSRPSDALALAVRTNARIRVVRALADDAPDVDFLSAEDQRAIARIRGVTVATPTDADRDRFALPSERDGVVVLHTAGVVTPRGVQSGDLIIAVAGRGVSSAVDFVEAMADRSRSSAVTVRIVRDGEERDVEVAPGRAPGRVS